MIIAAHLHQSRVLPKSHQKIIEVTVEMLPGDFCFVFFITLQEYFVYGQRV